jgi:hypothetical protein
VVLANDGRAVIRVTDDLSSLRTKANAYATEDTRFGTPRYRNLVARIDEIALATIGDLSFGEISDDVPDTTLLWVEIWTRGGKFVDEVERARIESLVATFEELTPDGSPAGLTYRGAERDVHLVLATGASLKALPVLFPDVAEVHLAPHVLRIALAEAADEAGDLAVVIPPADQAPVVAIHDSGIDADHPYVMPVLLGIDSVVPGETGTFDSDGHGTQIGGVAAYSALADGVANGRLNADAWLVSVRLLESERDAGGDPDRGAMWAARTTEAIATAEALAGGSPVVHNISLGAENPSATHRLDRTSWSIATDTLAWNDGNGRLLVVAAGNADPIVDPGDYPYINLGPPHIQQPAQGWNVLTIGGFTALDHLTADDLAMGYPVPLAQAGELSPHSRSATVGNKPIKPDLVMEAGNTAPDGTLENPEAQGLSILTLRSSAEGGTSLLRRTCKTSPAAAAASNALAQIAANQPGLRPATWRALLTHTAHWPDAAIAQMTDRRDLLRSFGYGVPDPTRAATSDSNRPVMVYEGSLQPSRRGADRKPNRPADFIEIPMPVDELEALEASATLRVTLSYFVEPTDNASRRTYAGGRLRWDLQGPSETEDTFRSRINRLVADQGVPTGGGSYRWDIPADDRSRGTLQHDRATVDAAAIAGPRLLAVYPVVGWWEDAEANWERDLPYSVVVSVDFGDVDIDLYAMTAQILTQVPVVEV